MTQLDLLSYTPPAPQYPFIAGAKEQTTSKDAADKIEDSGRAEALRVRCLAALRSSIFGLSADQIAEALNEHPFSIRPRCAELHKRNLIIDSGRRAKNSSGASAKIWVVK